MKITAQKSSGHQSRLAPKIRNGGLVCTIALALGAGCSGDASSLSGVDATSEEQLGEVTQHFDPSPSPAAKKGHVMITMKALELLTARNMLPEQLKSAEAQALIVYGNNFSDSTGAGWPKPATAGNLPKDPVKNHMTSLIPTGGTAVFGSTADSFTFEATNSRWEDPDVTVTGRASIEWVPGTIDPAKDPEGNHLSASMRLLGSTTIDTDVFWEGLASGLSCVGSAFGASDCKWVEPDPITEPQGFSLDNLYHYSYGDVKDFGLPFDQKDTALRLYPLLPSHVPGHDGDETHRDVANKLAAQLQNQTLLADADFGAVKYGAILYQLSRRFFAGSRQPEPDLGALIKVGNDIPGWRTGFMRGSGGLNDMKLEFPHTYLGGMPYTCAPPSATWRSQAITAFANADKAAKVAKEAFARIAVDINSLQYALQAQAAATAAAKAAAPFSDVCASGKPTWPAWIKSGYQGKDLPPQTDDDLRSLEIARPGRSDRAGLIYLGWAVHMIQDSSLPHHVSGWTGKEHSAQDALGDLEFYYKDFSRMSVPQTTCKIPASKLGPAQLCTTTMVPHPYAQYSKYLVDKTIAMELEGLLGPVGAPKSRPEICKSLGIHDGEGSATDLRWRSVYPVYVKNAAQAYESRLKHEKLSGTAALDAGAMFIKNAVLGSAKLLLCAPPNVAEPPSTFASGFVWAQSATGSFTADANYSSNSSGTGTAAANTVTQLSTGTYRVDFPGLGLETGGNVQVTAYGGSSERCKVGGWSSSGSTLSATVFCHNTAGALVNTQFTASYLRRPASASGQATGGYLWANQPSTEYYTPSTTYQWNASGALNTIQRYGVGSYAATFPGVNLYGGTVEVTAYGSSSDYCKVGYWGSNVVGVSCFNNAGAPVDSAFTLSFTDSSPHATPSFHYAWADQPSTQSYTPSTYYQRGYLATQCGGSVGTMTMSRYSTGSYQAFIPNLNATGSNVKVTAYGGSADTCKVMSWGSSSNGTQVGVACFNPAGQPVDTYFTIVYSNNQYIVC
jgi:hypothetical protein